MKRDYSNLMYENNLSQEATDFLEAVKTRKFHIHTPGYANNINVVNSAQYFSKMIQGQNFTVGSFKKAVSLETHVSRSEQSQTLKEIQLARKSTRKYSGDPLTVESVASLLDLVYFEKDMDGRKRRNIASGGGLYPVECYYLHLIESDLPIGVYHYNLGQKSLFPIRTLSPEEMKEHVDEIFFTEYKADIDVQNAAGVLVFAGNVNKAAFKYEDKAIKWSFYDTGALLQMTYLSAAINHIGCCGCGGYLDDKLDDFLKLNYYQQTCHSVVFLGHHSSNNG